MSDTINHEAVLDATEATLDVIEEGIDGTVEVLEVVRNNPKVLVAVGVLAAAAGAAGGYFFAKKRLTAWYENTTTVEIAEAKEFYANLNRVNVDGTPLSPQDVMEKLHGSDAAAEALREYQGRHDEIDAIQNSTAVLSSPDDEPELKGEPHDDVVDEEHIQKMERSLKTEKVETPFGEATVTTENVGQTNVFVDPSFDLEEEKKYRTKDAPYIITHDEFYEAERDYETSSLTYFETDDVLVDEHDKPIDDINGTVGDDHLVRFGSGSKDKNKVFIRNEKLEIDFELSKSSGSYLEEVLGIPKEDENSLKHSDNRDARRAFRHGDG